MPAPVTIYAATNLTGVATPIQYGDYPTLTGTGVTPRTASSIDVAAFTEAYLYSAIGYGGEMIKIVGPVKIPNLGVAGLIFNDKLQSMRIVFVAPPLEAQVACCRGTSNASCGPYVPGSGRCTQSMLDYCPSNMDAGCREWAKNNTAAADGMMLTWCAKNPTDPFCSCVLSKASTKLGVNPACIDGNCIRSAGYLTTTMKQFPCPSIINCEMQVMAANSGVQVGASIPIQQNCGGNTTTVANAPLGQTTIKNTGTPEAVATPSYTSPSPQAAAPTHNWTMILFLIFVVVAWLCGMAYMLWPSSPSHGVPKK
jgi:hypothetical protein